MEIAAIDHLNFSVNNLNESIDWYTKIFGFRVVEHSGAEDVPYAILRAANSMLCIYEFPDRQFKDRFALKDSKLHGMNHFALRITDQVAWEQVIKENHLEVSYGSEIRWPHSTAWYVKDPTGYEIEVALWDDNKIQFS